MPVKSSVDALGFRAGAAEVTINPPVGAPLLGTIQRSTGVHDNLFARALVLEGATRIVAIVSCDLIGMDFVLADEIRRAIEGRTGISAILLNCSHNHSAPFTIPWSVLGPRWLEGPGQAWRNGLAPSFADLVARAVAKLAPSTLHVGREPVQIGFNRRLLTDGGVVMKPNPEGSVVPWVDVLRVDGPDGNPSAVLFSHAAHPVVIHGHSKLISADYPGCAVQLLKEKFGNGVIPLFAQACGGDINAHPLRGGFESAEVAGRGLANATYDAAKRCQKISSKDFRFTSLSTELPLALLPDREACWSLLKEAEHRLMERCGPIEIPDVRLWNMQDEIAPPDTNGSTEGDDVQPMGDKPWWLMDNVLCLRDTLQKIERVDERPLRFDAHLLRFGDTWSLLSASHELFSEYQLWADRELPSAYKMFLAYTNGCESYIPTDRDFALGGYEAVGFPSLDGAGFKYKHRRPLQPGTEQRVIETLRRLWN